MTCSCSFFISNKLEPLKFKLEKKSLVFRNMQEIILIITIRMNCMKIFISYWQTHCDVNYQNWPWGMQNCTYTSGSWTYPKEDLDFQPYLGPTESRTSPCEFERLDKNQVNTASNHHTVQGGRSIAWWTIHLVIVRNSDLVVWFSFFFVYFPYTRLSVPFIRQVH